MRRIFVKFLTVFFTFVLIGVIQKLLFLAAHADLSPVAVSISDWFNTIIHGLPMDCAVAAYFTSVPLLLLLIQCLTGPRRFFRIAETVWFAFSAAILAAVTVLDLGLYSSWGFRLDMSPVFYFSTSPSAAMASVTASQTALGAGGFLLLGVAFFAMFRFGAMRIDAPAAESLSTGRRRSAVAVAALVMGGLLFLAMRGGFTVSTMNMSRAYFSSNQFLNHAAINPFFSLFYSASHQEDFGSQFRYMSDGDARREFEAMHISPSDSTRPDSLTAYADSILSTPRPDIYIILLESFSAELMPSLGGEPIAVRLDSIGAEGMLFTNFYANSFRTDRGIPAVLSAFPGAPTASVMKFVEKTQNIPSIASSLGDNGWECSYYYGGDINFTNMLAYLINTGFSHTVCDKDFPIAERTGKWGAHDHLLFSHAIREIAATAKDAAPQLRVIQTSSSHEPFKVPYSRLADERANAFAYTDSCTADFLRQLPGASEGRQSLVVLVPDHFGAYPKNLRDPLRRHHVPLILTGNALSMRHTTIPTVGSQVDIAATLLGMLGIDSSDFTFSHNLFDVDTPRVAFFSEPTFMGIVTPEGHATVNLESGETAENSLAPDTLLTHRAKAYMQILYDEFQKL